MEDSSQKKKKYTTIILLALIILLGYLGYVISKLNKQNYEITKELSGILEENKEIIQDLIIYQIMPLLQLFGYPQTQKQL